MPTVFPNFRRAIEEVGLFYDYTKGLDLRKQGVGLQPKYSPDACNVDWQTDGGWCTRQIVKPFNVNNLKATPCALSTFENASGSTWVIVSYEDGSVETLAGSIGQTTAPLLPAGGECKRAAEVNFKDYLLDGVSPNRSWDGSTLATLGQAQNSDRNLRTNGNMPIARYSTIFAGYMWIFDTLEVGVRHCNRARWSFPLINLGGEQDWHPDDYIDINLGEDGECITGIQTCGNRIIVFKQHKTYEITASSNPKFSVREITGTMGAASQESTVCCGGRVWAWDSVGGIHVVQDVPNNFGQSVYSEDKIDDPISRLVTEMLVPNELGAKVSAICCGDKVLFSVPFKGGKKRTYVYDTSMNTWAYYDLQLGASVGFAPKDGKAYCLAVNADTSCKSRILALGQMGQIDDFGSCKSPVSFYVVTPWVVGASLVGHKLFECAEMVIEGKGRVDVTVEQDFKARVVGISTLQLGLPLGDFILDQVKITHSALIETNVHNVRDHLPPRVPHCQPVDPGCHGKLCEANSEGFVSMPMPKCEARSVRFRFSGQTTNGPMCLRTLALRWRASARKC